MSKRIAGKERRDVTPGVTPSIFAGKTAAGKKPLSIGDVAV